MDRSSPRAPRCNRWRPAPARSRGDPRCAVPTAITLSFSLPAVTEIESVLDFVIICEVEVVHDLQRPLCDRDKDGEVEGDGCVRSGDGEVRVARWRVEAAEHGHVTSGCTDDRSEGHVAVGQQSASPGDAIEVRLQGALRPVQRLRRLVMTDAGEIELVTAEDDAVDLVAPDAVENACPGYFVVV